MLTDNVGLKYGYNIADYNKTSMGQNAYSRLTREAASANLEDNQVITQPAPSGDQSSQASADYRAMQERRFDPDSSPLSEDASEYSQLTKEAEAAEKQELQNKILNVKDTGGLENPKSVYGEKATDHAKNKHDGFEKDCPLCDCETCKNRRYQDDSNDSAVSFQQATKMSPEKAAHMVKSHEMEHVRREQHKANKEGKRIVSQTVQIKTDICPECGKTYVAGGLTRTRTRNYNPEYIDLFKVGAEDITKKDII